MATVELTRDNFDDTVRDSDITLIDFWAAWCGPCRAFGRVFETVSARHPDVVFGKVDTEAHPELAAAFEIMSIPTLVAMRDNVILYSQPGALPERALEDLVGAVRGVDMAEVHRQVVAAAAPTAS